MDVESGGVYFNVLANGLPYALGTERGKGSHSMAGYHSFELCYLAAIYSNFLINNEPMDFFFAPLPGGFEDNILRVAPDILPPGSIKLEEVWLNGQPYKQFDAKALTVTLPETDEQVFIRVRIVPGGTTFSADLLLIEDGIAKIELDGVLEGSTLRYLKEEIEKAHAISGLYLDMAELTGITSEALRYLIFFKQKAGANFAVTIANATGSVKDAIECSELNEEVTLV